MLGNHYPISLVSAAGVGASTQMFNIVSGAARGFILRRLDIGIMHDSGSPTNLSAAVQIARATARGTATATTAPGKSDSDQAASTITGADTAWSAGATPGAIIGNFAVTTVHPRELYFWEDEGIVCRPGTANGILIYNYTLALPALHRYVGCAWIEEF